MKKALLFLVFTLMAISMIACSSDPAPNATKDNNQQVAANNKSEAAKPGEQKPDDTTNPAENEPEPANTNDSEPADATSPEEADQTDDATTPEATTPEATSPEATPAPEATPPANTNKPAEPAAPATKPEATTPANTKPEATAPAVDKKPATTTNNTTEASKPATPPANTSTDKKPTTTNNTSTDKSKTATNTTKPATKEPASKPATKAKSLKNVSLAGKRVAIVGRDSVPKNKQEDQFIEAHLKSLKMRPTLLEGKQVTKEMLKEKAYDLVIFMPTVNEGTIEKDQFVGLEVPTLWLKSMGMIREGLREPRKDKEPEPPAKEKVFTAVIPKDSPLAEQLSGTVTLWKNKETGLDKYIYAGGVKPYVSGAVVFATNPGDATKAVAYGYDKGTKGKTGTVTKAKFAEISGFTNQGFHTVVEKDGMALFEGVLKWLIQK